MIYQDYALDDDGDLKIQDGDFVVEPSDTQHVKDILEAFPGEYKQFPLLGVGLLSYLKSQNPNDAVNVIKQQLQSDGFVVGAIKTAIDKSGNLIVAFPGNGVVRNV